MSEDVNERHWEIDFKHGTYRLMNDSTELRRFQTLRELREFCENTLTNHELRHSQGEQGRFRQS